MQEAFLYIILVFSFCFTNIIGIPISTSDLTEDNHHGFEYRTILDNGSSQHATGTIKEINGTNILVIQGSYAYNLPNGDRLTVYYLADENGYNIQSISQRKISSAERTETE